MRSLACPLLAVSLLLACSGDGNMLTTQSTKTADPSSSSGDATATNPTSTDATMATDASGTTQTPGTTDAAGTTTAVTTGTPDTDPTTAGTTTSATTGADEGLMGKYGAPCATDADCVAVLGEGGICVLEILGVYDLPGGYCSSGCDLPDQQTTYNSMAADCKLGADCVGLMGFFEACAFPCTDNSQCPREGYECRPMPEISNPGDPSYCLMTEEYKKT